MRTIREVQDNIRNAGKELKRVIHQKTVYQVDGAIWWKNSHDQQFYGVIERIYRDSKGTWLFVKRQEWNATEMFNLDDNPHWIQSRTWTKKEREANNGRLKELYG